MPLTPIGHSPRRRSKTPRRRSASPLDEYERSYNEWKKQISEYHRRPTAAQRLSRRVTKAVFGEEEAPAPSPSPAPAAEEEVVVEVRAATPAPSPAPGEKPPMTRSERRRSVMASMIQEVRARTERLKPKYGPPQAMTPLKKYNPPKLDFGMGSMLASKGRKPKPPDLTQDAGMLARLVAESAQPAPAPAPPSAPPPAPPPATP